jgi:hypothetical protein
MNLQLPNTALEMAYAFLGKVFAKKDC